MSFPIVDISSPTITAVTMYVDVLHNRNDNFQDRFEFVARAGNDPSSLGDYKRESGVASFKNGVINGADTGIILGGSDAAATIESVTVNSPVFAGLDIDGSIGGSSIDDLEVNGGDYGMYVSSFARGKMDVTNFDFDAQDNAGIYYVTDMGGDHWNDHQQQRCCIQVRCKYCRRYHVRFNHTFWEQNWYRNRWFWRYHHQGFYICER